MFGKSLDFIALLDIQMLVNDDSQLNIWSKYFGRSSNEIRLAVARVGPMANDVKLWLDNHKGHLSTKS